MKIEAKKIKLWCDQNLSPVAWKRIMVKVSPHFRGSGIKLSALLEPDETILFNDQQYALIKKTVEDTYNVGMAITV